MPSESVNRQQRISFEAEAYRNSREDRHVDRESFRAGFEAGEKRMAEQNHQLRERIRELEQQGAAPDGGFGCVVPWLDGSPLTNAVGSCEREARVNMDPIGLSITEINRVEFRLGYLTVSTPSTD